MQNNRMATTVLHFVPGVQSVETVVEHNKVSHLPTKRSEKDLTYGRGKEKPRTGVISQIVNDVQSEKGSFFMSKYTEKYLPSTVQGVFSVLKAANVIQPDPSAQKGERGKYVLTKNLLEAQIKQLQEENKMLNNS